MTPIHKRSFARVIGLILEEIEGCELDPGHQETRDLRRIIDILQKMAKDQDRPKQQQQQLTLKPQPQKTTRQPYVKKAKKWQNGPLGGQSRNITQKPVWFTHDAPDPRSDL
jgi:hypothetical protein